MTLQTAEISSIIVDVIGFYLSVFVMAVFAVAMVLPSKAHAVKVETVDFYGELRRRRQSSDLTARDFRQHERGGTL